MTELRPTVTRDTVAVLVACAKDAIRRSRDVISVKTLLSQLTLVQHGGTLTPLAVVRCAQTLSRLVEFDQQTIQTSDVKPTTDQTEIDCLLRDVTWRALRQLPTGLRILANRRETIRWDDRVRLTIGFGMDQAKILNANYMSTAHLLVGLLRLTSQGSDDDLTLASISEATRLLADSAEAMSSGEPDAPLIELLKSSGVSVDTEPWLVRFLTGYMYKLVARKSRYGGPVLHWFESEIQRQAARRGDNLATTGHAVLAMLSFDWQTRNTDFSFPKRIAAMNSTPEVLRENAATLFRTFPTIDQRIERSATSMLEGERATADVGPSWTTSTAMALDNAIDIANSLGHGETGVVHLLEAILRQEENVARELLEHSGADPSMLLAIIQDR